MRHLILAALVLSACHASAPPPLATPPIVDHSRPAKPIGMLPPAEAAAAIESVYRLAPDRRFLLAVRDLYALQEGRSATVDIDFKNGAWEVRCDGRDVGRLPLLPTFNDGFQLLAAWSRALKPFTKKTEDETRNAVFLDVQLVDVFELGDPVAARALALLTLARAANPRFGDDEKALLANAMSYETEAAHMAASLPPGSAARIATGLDAPQLGSKVPLIAYVSATRVLTTAPRTQRERVAPLLGEQDLNMIPLLMRSDDLTEAGPIAEDVQRLLTREVDGSALRGRVRVGVSDWIDRLNEMLKGGGPGELAATYESKIARFASRRATPLIGEDVIRAWYDALYYTSIERQFRIRSDHWGSEEHTSAFLKELGTADSQPGRDVRDTLAFIKATKFGSGRGVMAKQLLAAKNIGAGLRADLFDDLARMRDANRGDLEAEPAIVSLLDTRPTQRFEAGLIALHVTYDPMRRELYLRSAIDAAPNSVKPGYVSYFASLIGDKEQLRRLMDRHDLSPYDRACAANYLADAGDPQSADRGFEQLFRESNSPDFYSVWAGMVNKRHAWAAKERVARQWLDRHPDRDIQHAYYAASLGNALEEQGRYAEAWTIVAPDLDVWSANIIEAAVSLHQRLGRIKQSDDLGRQLVERYPGAWTRSSYAVVLWRQKRWADAAALFNPKLAAYSASEWDEHVPEEMETLFEHAPAGDMAAATGALVDAGVSPTRLDQLVLRLREDGHPELAFAAADEICKRIPLKNEPDSAQHYIEAYRALAAWKGHPFAIRWLRERLTDQNALEVAGLLFQGHEDEAVLALADFAPRVRTDELQVFLAGAMTRLRLPDSDPRVVALRKEVAAQKYDPKALHAVTRYFLGLMDEKEFLGWSSEPWARVSILYAIGLKSAAAGDYDRGLQYMLAARHVGFDTSPQAWAVEQLGVWNHELGTWHDIVARRIL